MKNQLRPVGNRILVKKFIDTKKGLIILPNQTIQKNFMGLVVDVGDINNKSIKVGRVVICNWQSVHKYDDFFLVDEKDVFMVYLNKIWRPLGRKLMLRRMVEEFKVGGVVVPGCIANTDQSLHCIFVLNGVINDEIVESFDLIGGDTVKLVRWDHSIQEISIDDEYYLIANPSNILYAVDGEDVENRVFK